MIILTSSSYRITFDGNPFVKWLAHFIKWTYMVDEHTPKFYLVANHKKLAKKIYKTAKYEVNNGCTKLIKPVTE